jgi:DNA anti-recombination protein RmuC
MQQSKNLAVMFLLGAVLVGGALGFTADRVMIRDQICTSHNPRDMRKMLADRLQLSATQEKKMDSVLDERHRRIQAVMATVRDTLDSVRARSGERMESILNDAQKQRFHELLAELKDSTRSRERDKDR